VSQRACNSLICFRKGSFSYNPPPRPLPPIGHGLKTAEIADQLHLSVKTVETYRDRIRQKLGMSDGTRLAHFATQWLMENG
jgi:hypothetical protein